MLGSGSEDGRVSDEAKRATLSHVTVERVSRLMPAFEYGGSGPERLPWLEAVTRA